MKTTLSLVTTLIILSFCGSLAAQTSGLTPLRIIQHPSEDAFLGNKVQIEGNWAFISAPFESIDGINKAGAVYVYQHLDDAWHFSQRITADSLAWADRFGFSIATHGDWLAIGSRSVRSGANHSGIITMFRRQNESWVKQEVLSMETNPKIDFIGVSISMNESYLVAGGQDHHEASTTGGGVVIYKRENGNWSLMQEITLDADAIHFEFGRSVALSEENELFIGAPRASSPDSLAGAVFIYELSNSDIWERKHLLQSPNPQLREFFGDAIAEDNGILVIGAPGGINDSIPTGSAYVFKKMGHSWILVEHLHPGFPQTNMKYGSEVDISNGLITIGARRLNRNMHRAAGGAFVYLMQNESIAEYVVLSSHQPQEFGLFGSSVAVHGNHVLVGAHLHNNGHDNAGSAFFYKSSDLFVSIENEYVTQIPKYITLSQNYPNPFNPSTNIVFELPGMYEVRLEVFDVLGRKVTELVNGTMQAGRHEVVFDAGRLSSGVYVYRLQVESPEDGLKVFTRKLTLLK